VNPAAKAKTVSLAGLALFGWAYGWTWINGSAGALSAPTTVPPAPGAPAETGWAAPLAGDTWARANLNATHAGYPAIDIPAPPGAPLYAMEAGTVSYVGGDCGLGIRVTGPAGTAIKFCHASARWVLPGANVAAGQHIANAGSTGHTKPAGYSHLHVEVTAGGQARCPQPLLLSLRSTGAAPDPAQLPTGGCTH
jgi:murein DD-endopeptidase MepM/ murein hydrolase activator NlpD